MKLGSTQDRLIENNLIRLVKCPYTIRYIRSGVVFNV